MEFSDKRGFLIALMRSRQTVFSFRELMLMWGGIDAATARARVHYYVKSGALRPLRRGLYAKDEGYDRFELATRILTPAYISMETVLSAAGIIFQHDDRIHIASYQSKEMAVDGVSMVFRTLRESILLNPAGVDQSRPYAIATPERALLDVIYLNRDYHFDNLRPIDWEKVERWMPVYGGHHRLEKSVYDFRKSLKESG